MKLTFKVLCVVILLTFCIGAVVMFSITKSEAALEMLGLAITVFFIGVAVAVGAVWSAVLMKTGGQMVIDAAHSDNKADVAKINMLTRALSVVRAEGQKQKALPLPIPQENEYSWLPSVDALPGVYEDVSGEE